MPLRDMDREQMWLLPPSLDELLPLDHPARFVAVFVDALDKEGWAELGVEIDGDPLGAPAYHTRALLCVWLYGFMTGVRSCRKLEAACRDQIPYLWLQVPAQVPLLLVGEPKGKVGLGPPRRFTFLFQGQIDFVLVVSDGGLSQAKGKHGTFLTSQSATRCRRPGRRWRRRSWPSLLRSSRPGSPPGPPGSGERWTRRGDSRSPTGAGPRR